MMTMETNSSDRDYTTAFTVDQTPAEVFAAINNVRGWWAGEIEGSYGKVGDEFTYRYKDFHTSKHRVTELVPGKRVVWLVLEARLDFVEDKNEWKGTKTVFEISPRGKKTEVRFTHSGLLPDLECFDACSGAWAHYVNGSLRKLITTGKDQSD